MDASALRKGPRRAAQTAVVNWIAGSNCCDATAIVCDSIVTTRLALGMTVCLMTQPPSVLCRYRNGGSHDGVDAPIAAIKLITSVCAARFLTPIFVHDYAFAIAPSQSKFCIQYLFRTFDYAAVPASRPSLSCDFSPGSMFLSWTLSMEDEIAGVQVYGSDVFQKQGVMTIERDQRIATLLGFGRKSRG
jgi:hypothetical protein